MSLQIIKSEDGKPEYVLLPISIYKTLRGSIEKELAYPQKREDYEPFHLKDYVDNPVALARIEAKVTQEDLAESMGVTQAYVSKIESQNIVSPKALAKVKVAIISLQKQRNNKNLWRK